MKIRFDTLEELKAFNAFVQGTHNQGEAIMAALDDLKAALTATGAALAGVSTNVGEIKTGVAALAAEVAALIALIGGTPGIPQEVVDAANALKSSAEALVADSQAVEDQIAAIPPVPAAG